MEKQLPDKRTAVNTSKNASVLWKCNFALFSVSSMIFLHWLWYKIEINFVPPEQKTKHPIANYIESVGKKWDKFIEDNLSK